MRIKYIISSFFTFCTLLFTTDISAGKIYFQGAIVEDSCSSSSSNVACKNLSKAIKTVKMNTQIDQLLLNKSKNVAHLAFINTHTKSTMHKMLLVTYH